MMQFTDQVTNFFALTDTRESPVNVSERDRSHQKRL